MKHYGIPIRRQYNGYYTVQLQLLQEHILRPLFII